MLKINLKKVVTSVNVEIASRLENWESDEVDNIGRDVKLSVLEWSKNPTKSHFLKYWAYWKTPTRDPSGTLAGP